MTALTNYIQSYFGVEQSFLNEIAQLFEEKVIPKGSYFIQEGRYNIGLGFITEGYLRIYGNMDGKEVTQWISGPGDFITDLGSLVFDTPAKKNIIALEECVLYYIDKEKYHHLNTIVPKWEMLEKRFIAKCFMTLEDRIYSFLSMNAEERYHFLFEYRPELFHSVPLQFLASLLGMTPETFSRIRNKNLKTS